MEIRNEPTQKDNNRVSSDLRTIDESPDIIDVGKIRADDRIKEMRRYSILTKAAYDYYDKNGDIKAVEDEVQKYLPKHTIVPEHSDNNSIVATKIGNDGVRDVIISYRGTRPSNPGDLAADTQILLGLPAERLGNTAVHRFREAENKYKAVKAAYPDADISITGHSLGASQGLFVAKKYDEKAHLFDVGSSPADLIFTPQTNNNPVDIYYTPGDLISTSNSLLDKKDRLHKIEHPSWKQQLAGTGILAGTGAIICGPGCALAGGGLGVVYNQFLSPNSFHSMTNYLPKEVFPLEEITKNQKRMYNEVKEGKKVDEYRLKQQPFSPWLYPKIPKAPINPGRHYNNNFCFNANDKGCKKSDIFGR